MSQSADIVSPLCSVASGHYMRALFTLLAARHAVWAVLPVALGVALSFRDVRWLIVTAILVFMAFPLVLAMLYINFGFAPIARWSMMEKTVTFTRQGLTLDFTHPRMSQHEIAWSQVSHVTVIDGKDVLIVLKSSRYSFLLLPEDLLGGDPSVGKLCRELLAGSL